MHFVSRHPRRGVSPVPAELLLLALVVVGGVIVYVFVSGFATNLSKSGSQPVTTRLSLDAYTYPASGPLTFVLRNVGTTSVSIETVYFNGSPVASPGCSGTVSPESTIQCSFTPSPVPASGTTVPVKVVTASGGTYQFNVQVGGST